MSDIRQNLEGADEHLEKADEKLRAVAQEVRSNLYQSQQL